MIKRKSLLFWSAELLIVATLIWVCTKLDFLFHPIIVFISVIFVPLIVSIFLYYMTSPAFRLLMKIRLGKWQMKRGIASMVIVLGLLLLIVGSLAVLIPPMIKELNQMIHWLPSATNDMQHWLAQASQKHEWIRKIDLADYYQQFNKQITKYAEKLLASLTSSVGSIIGTITSAVIVVVTVPVMLFYMLKDGDRFVPNIQRFFSEKHAKEVTELLHQMNKTLSSYISGQMIECICVGIGTCIGYLIIGEPMAIVLGLVAGITNIIPYIGPYIGIAPALIVALAVDPQKIIWVIVVVIVVQQIDGNIIYPIIIGKSLQIHPLTIIILLLAAGNIAGLLGMILCVPLYAVVKTMVDYCMTIYRLEKNDAK